LGKGGGQAAEDLTFHGVDGEFDGGDLFRCEGGEVGSFWDEAADEAVVVFIGSSLEGAEGMGVIKRATGMFGVEGGSFDGFKVPELAAVVAGQAFHVGEGIIGLPFEVSERP